MAKSLTLLLVAAVVLSGCSSFTAEGRRQAAVRHQIAKAKKERIREQAATVKEANRPLREPMTISQPQATISLEPVGSSIGPVTATDSTGAPVVVETSTSEQPNP